MFFLMSCELEQDRLLNCRLAANDVQMAQIRDMGECRQPMQTFSPTRLLSCHVPLQSAMSPYPQDGFC